MTDVPRRRVLRVAGSTVLAAPLAGCLSEPGDGDGSDGNGDGGGQGDGSDGSDDGDSSDGGVGDPGALPSYAAWIRADDLPEAPLDAGPEEMLTFVHADFESLRDLFDGESDPVETDPDAGNGEEPMVVIPTLSLLVFSFAPLMLVPYGVDNVPMFEEGGEGGKTPAIVPETATMVGDALVFSGEVNVDALESSAEGFEAADERGDYTIYEGTGGDGGVNTEGLAFAASDEVAVFPVSDGGPGAAPGDRELIDRRLDLAVGDASSATGEDPEFDWVLRTAGRGAAVIGTYGKQEGGTYGDEFAGEGGDGAGDSGVGGDLFEFDALDDLPMPLTQVASMETGESAPVSATTALAYDDAGVVPSREGLGAAFGATASRRSVEVEGGRVAIEASWDDAGVLDGGE